MTRVGPTPCDPAESTDGALPRASWTASRSARVCVASLDEKTTQIVFEARAPKRRQHIHHTLVGQLEILAHSEAQGVFVIGPRVAPDQPLPLYALYFLDEHSGDVRDSQYRNSLTVMLSVSGPDPDLVALFGRFFFPPDVSENGDRLEINVNYFWLYRISTDELFHLGPAPPPPSQRVPCRRVDLSPERFGAPIQPSAYADVDRELIHFESATTLALTYPESCGFRHPSRVTRRWDLKQLPRPVSMPWICSPPILPYSSISE